MNYRHAYHAGNFADVVKHAILALLITHLKQKETPFRVIDTHAGAGLYDLLGEAAGKTQEWREGIGRLIGPEAAPIPAPAAAALEPYLHVVRALNAKGRLARYPGSPRLARALLRPGDRLVVNELHPEDGAALRRLFARDPHTKVLGLDGWMALKSLLPPKERRGVILVDPPFEAPGELGRLVNGLCQAVERFATGIYLLWYPIKDEKPVATLHRALVGQGFARLLKAEVLIRRPRDSDRLNGAGLLVLNPPFTLVGQLEGLLPFLAERLAQGPGARDTLAWLSGDKASDCLT